MKAVPADLNYSFQFIDFISTLGSYCVPSVSRKNIGAALATVSFSHPKTRNQTPAQFPLKGD
jgi:hypothetical protein